MHDSFCFLRVDYQAKLDTLREPIPERALYVPADEGAGKAHCFTNYEPHFNPAQKLDAIIMGAPPEGWRLVDSATWSDGEKIYGYKDTKPYYEVGFFNSELVCSVFLNICVALWVFFNHFLLGGGQIGLASEGCRCPIWQHSRVWTQSEGLDGAPAL